MLVEGEARPSQGCYSSAVEKKIADFKGFTSSRKRTGPSLPPPFFSSFHPLIHFDVTFEGYCEYLFENPTHGPDLFRLFNFLT